MKTNLQAKLDEIIKLTDEMVIMAEDSAWLFRKGVEDED